MNINYFQIRTESGLEVRVLVSLSKRRVNIYVHVPAALRSMMSGLCGNFDGSHWNDVDCFGPTDMQGLLDCYRLVQLGKTIARNVWYKASLGHNQDHRTYAFCTVFIYHWLFCWRVCGNLSHNTNNRMHGYHMHDHLKNYFIDCT